jgi:hypothetical protein
MILPGGQPRTTRDGVVRGTAFCFYYFVTAQTFAWLTSGPTCAVRDTSDDCFCV